MCYNILQITGAKLIEWFNSPISLLNYPLATGQQSGLSPNAIVITTRVRFLVKMIKRDLNGAYMAVKSVLKSGFDIFCDVYERLSNHELLYKLAEKILNWKKVKGYRRMSKEKVLKLIVLQTLSRSKRKKPKPKFRSTLRSSAYLRRLMTSQAKISASKSFETIDASSCSSMTFNDVSYERSFVEQEASFEVLPQNDFHKSQVNLSNASSDQPLKMQPLSQWDLNTPNMMFENSPMIYNETKKPKTSSCWSNSSYEVIPTSRSSSGNTTQEEIEPQLPNLSISSCSFSETDEKLTYSTAQKSEQSNFSSQSGICFQFNKIVENGSSVTSDIESCNPTKTSPKTKGRFSSPNSGKANLDGDLNTLPKTKKHDDNIKQLFPKLSTGISGWPRAESQELNTNIWDTNRDVPVLNSLKKSYDSSFNFDDSRFNSFSPELNQFQFNQPFLNVTTGIKSSKTKEDTLCDFSHILNMTTNVQPNHGFSKPRALSHSRFFNCEPQPTQPSLLAPGPGINPPTGHQIANPLGLPQINSRRTYTDQLMQIFKSQRDEINNLRTKVARDSIALSEHQALLQEVGKSTIEKAQAIEKRSRQKLARAQTEEILRCNALLDKKMSELTTLQRRCSFAKAHEYKLKTHQQWKPYEI